VEAEVEVLRTEWEVQNLEIGAVQGVALIGFDVGYLAGEAEGRKCTCTKKHYIISSYGHDGGAQGLLKLGMVPNLVQVVWARLLVLVQKRLMWAKVSTNPQRC
jgi:hypothetical protein